LFSKVLTASYALVPGIYSQHFQHSFVARTCVSSENTTLTSISQWSFNFSSKICVWTTCP